MKTVISLRSIGFLMLFALAGIANPSIAQQDSTSSKWHFLAEPYLVLPTMTGTMGVGRILEAEIDASASDIFGNLKFGLMLNFEATNDKWSVGTDFLYMKLKQDLEPRIEYSEGDVTAKEMVWELSGLRKVTPWLELGLAGRLVGLEMGLNYMNDSPPYELVVDESSSKTWYDPVIVVRSQGLIHDKWMLRFRADAGGFGIGSDFTWQLQANAGYRFSKLFHTTIGYRYIGIDYNKGEGSDTFIYDVDTYGLEMRFGFNF